MDLLRPKYTKLDPFFAKGLSICVRARIFFRVILVILEALGGSFFRALDGFAN